MPIKGLTDGPRRLPRIGKIHLGVKLTTNKQGQPCAPYPRATEHFVFDPEHPQYQELVAAYGEKPTELRIIIPTDDEDAFASQYYRRYSQSRGLVCKGDGVTATRMVDTATGALANRDSKDVVLKEITCMGKECPEYGPRACGEVMNLQFLLPEVSGFGVWQIDTGSINSIININGALELVRHVYDRIKMIPLILALEPKEVVNPDDGKKKTVRVLNLRNPDKILEAYRKAKMPPLQLVVGNIIEGEFSEIETAEMPKGDETEPFSDLPEVGKDEPGADGLWPGPTLSEPKVGDGILWLGQKEAFPEGSLYKRVGLTETGEIWRWEEIDATSGRWVEEQRESVSDDPEPVPEGIVPTEDMLSDESIPTTITEFLTWLQDKGKKYNPTWFYRTFSYTSEDMKKPERIKDAYNEVKQLMNW